MHFNFFQYLKKEGIEPVLLTGDNEQNSLTICKELEIEEFHCNLTSEDKLRIVGKECFIGDGLNDSQALFNAGLGIGLRNKAASVILLNKNLSNIVDLLEILKRAKRDIKLTLF